MSVMRPLGVALGLLLLAGAGTSRAQAPSRFEPLNPGPRAHGPKVRLGQALFFDKILSGNRDIACATCHHPSLMTGDALSLSIGTKGIGLGPDRIKDPESRFIPRNATELFDRGSPEWRTMFWDFRVTEESPGRFQTPAGTQLPGGLDSVLAAQAMFPVTSRDEMRGAVGAPGNEISGLADDNFTGIWEALMARLMAIPEYRHMFHQAYPRVAPARLGFQHAANAIAAFEAAAFTRLDSPWDRHLAGHRRMLSASALRGAKLFSGSAGCVRCHSGSLFTDQSPHNLAVPQLGPGKSPEAPLDFGCGRVTGKPGDRFAFRTPPLRNVAVTGPWMHNGSYTTLEGAVRHHLNPIRSLLNYDKSQIAPALQPTVLDSPDVHAEILTTLDPLAQQPTPLSDREVRDILSFLESLTSPTLHTLENTIPATVPSGLPVDR